MIVRESSIFDLKSEGSYFTLLGENLFLIHLRPRSTEQQKL